MRLSDEVQKEYKNEKTKNTLGLVPTHLKRLLTLTRETQSRQTRYANFNIVCPVVKRQTEGRGTFTVTACSAWNSFPTPKSLRNSLWKKMFKEQRLLSHFIL